MANRKGTPREIATQGMSSVDPLGISTQGFREPLLGDMILGGAADVVITKIFTGVGGMIFGGAAAVSKSLSIIATGGMVFGGAAQVVFNITKGLSGRGGMKSVFRRARPKRDKSAEEVWDKLKKIIKDAEPKTYEFNAVSGCPDIKFGGSAQIQVVMRDIVPIEIIATIPHIIMKADKLFKNDITIADVIELDDALLISGDLETGQYDIEPEEKERHIIKSKKFGMRFSGTAKMEFISGLIKIQQADDENLIFDQSLINVEEDPDQEILELLGIL